MCCCIFDDNPCHCYIIIYLNNDRWYRCTLKCYINVNLEMLVVIGGRTPFTVVRLKFTDEADENWP